LRDGKKSEVRERLYPPEEEALGAIALEIAAEETQE
jgi:hypothetical protein